MPFPADRGDVVSVPRIAHGTLAERALGWNIRVRLTNPTDRPIQLDLNPRFFELGDDRGRKAELQFFCCEAHAELLELGREDSRPITSDTTRPKSSVCTIRDRPTTAIASGRMDSTTCSASSAESPAGPESGPLPARRSSAARSKPGVALSGVASRTS